MLSHPIRGRWTRRHDADRLQGSADLRHAAILGGIDGELQAHVHCAFAAAQLMRAQWPKPAIKRPPDVTDGGCGPPRVQDDAMAGCGTPAMARHGGARTHCELDGWGAPASTRICAFEPGARRRAAVMNRL